MLTYSFFNSLTVPYNLLILYLVLFCNYIVDESLNGIGCLSAGKIVIFTDIFKLLRGIYFDFILFK